MEKEIVFETINNEGSCVQANGFVSETADFFQDHFPDFPILPGVLAIEILKRTAEYGMTQEESLRKSSLSSVKAVKFAKYLKPGDSWKSEVTLLKKEGDKFFWKGRLLRGEEIAVSAKLELVG